jgi:hypothetical protein
LSSQVRRCPTVSVGMTTVAGLSCALHVSHEAAVPCGPEVPKAILMVQPTARHQISIDRRKVRS